MVLIISSEQDQKTNAVITWFRYLKVPFIRINDTTKVLVESFEILDQEDEDEDDMKFWLKLIYPNKSISYINSSEITGYWYRRGRINLFREWIDGFEVELSSCVNEFNKILGFELAILRDAIYYFFSTKKKVNDYLTSDANKLKNLVLAKKAGLKIPDTRIYTNKKRLKDELSKSKSIIKPMYAGGFSVDRYAFGGPTKLIKVEDLENSEERIFPSLTQSYIEKAYELRIFYLNGDCYSCAIFSQNDPKTKVDFRNYNREKGNRTSPYNLPTSMKTKIKIFMDSVDLNCGSLDIIVTKQKEYVFLEVNPIGQFFQVSFPCNYFLDEKIVNYLK